MYSTFSHFHYSDNYQYYYYYYVNLPYRVADYRTSIVSFKLYVIYRVMIKSKKRTLSQGQFYRFGFKFLNELWKSFIINLNSGCVMMYVKLLHYTITRFHWYTILYCIILNQTLHNHSVFYKQLNLRSSLE